MTNSNRDIAADRRITVLFVVLCCLLLFDVVNRHTSFGLQESAACEQLYVASSDKLGVKICRNTDRKKGQSPSLPARYSPFFYAAMPINSATKDMLMTVRGIGPVLAEAIVAYRRNYGPFANSEDLRTLPGVGSKRAARLAADFIFSETP